MDNVKKVYIKNQLLSKEIKKEALKRLQGKWFSAIISFIPIYVVGVIGGYANDKDTWLGLIIYMLAGVFLTVFSWGIYWSFLDSKDNPKSIGITSAFNFLKAKEDNKPFALVILACVYNILISLWSLLLLIPGIIKNFSYAQTYYYWYKDVKQNKTQDKLVDYITISRYRMNGFKLDLFKLELSFIGWGILSIFTLGIGLLFLLPYVSMANVVFSERLDQAIEQQEQEQVVLEENEEKVEEVND